MLDNYATHKTPAIEDWLLKHPGFPPALHAHQLIMAGSGERWLAELTSRKLRRSAHRSVAGLEADIRKWISEWNKDP